MSVHADPPPSLVPEPNGVQYATGGQLGKGGFAICHRAERLDVDRPTGHVVALKIVRTKMEPAKLAQKFITELQIHSKLHHSNIVEFFRAFSFESSTYVVLELCDNGSLADMLKKRKYLTMPEIRRFVIQICGAVKYLHYRNIVHRDLKTGNLFLDKDMNIKVGDFGLAALLVSQSDMMGKRRTTMCGTPNYLAPEILEKGKGHNEKVDFYTLAVGKAPFHASSKEEIYKKLKSRYYTWPELNSTTNNISSDLRDLVSSLLVHEEERPSPDQIVSHPFFKIAFVPTQLSAARVTRPPKWPQNQVPSTEVLQRGYSDGWYAVCKESGVGEYAAGKCFPLNGGKRIRSIVKDIEKEVAAGRQPVIPIPDGTVYTPFPESQNWPAIHAGALSEIVEEKESSAEGRCLREISPNGKAPVRVEKEEQKVPPTRHTHVSLPKSSMDPPPLRHKREPSRRNLETRLPAAPTRSLADDVATGTVRQTKLAPPEEPQTVKRSTTGTVRRAADPTLARRPRTTRKAPSSSSGSSERLTAPSEADSASLPVPQDRVPEQRPPIQAPMVRRSRKAPRHEVIEILSDAEDVEAPPPPRSRKAPTKACGPPPSAQPVLPPHPSAANDNTVPGTDPSTVLARLAIFRDTIASALLAADSAPAAAPPRSRRAAATAATAPPQPRLPFVSKWVDYSRKHGVGYVLEDGTVGCVVSARAPHPVMHVLVRDGQRHLKDAPRDPAALDRVPLLFFEDRGRGGIKRVELHEPGEAERRRMLGTLWAKFGKYMCGAPTSTSVGTCGGEDGGKLAAVDRAADGLVRFYQRLGNVGIWGFGDGSLQFNFPDHTKLVFSPTGASLAFTALSAAAYAHLTRTGDLSFIQLRSRRVLAFPLRMLLDPSVGPTTATGTSCSATTISAADLETVAANLLREKLEFVVRVVEGWVEGGGLGRGMDDRDGKGEGERMTWTGPQAEDGGKKMEWVTVGRYGGDGGR
ncbi:class II myosin [Cryomyces antarcticus]|uniref:Class II myosin n=1 Tax=Cryomyces antarcticus TaxID=329879 RepID=A0ABR0KU32_9PEZI|nr:class II myosin [Cryomyces antarcticus]